MPEPTPQILVAGAGDIGLGVAARLVAEGLAVATLNRSGRSVEGATPVRADLSDPSSLAGIDAFTVVVLTTAPDGRDDAAYRVAYVDGPRNLLSALPEAPARVVLTSTTGVYGVDDGGWVDAATPLSPTRSTAAIVVEGEQHLAALAPTVIVRAAGIYGPGRERLSGRVRAGQEPVDLDGPPRWTNRVHRDDLVAALCLAATHPAPPDVLVAVDDAPAPRAEVVAWLAEQMGVAVPPGPSAPTATGKRCRNDALRSLGWAPTHPDYRSGYADLLDRAERLDRSP